MAVQFFDISSVHPGMRLANSISLAKTELFYPSGSILSEEMLQHIVAEGIHRLPIAADDEGYILQKVSEDILAAATAAADEEFYRLAPRDSYVETLHAISVERRCQLAINNPGLLTKDRGLFMPPKPETLTMSDLLDSEGTIGTLPAIFHRLVDVINNPYSSAGDAAKIIAADPALCAKLLRLVNSPLYGLPARVDNIPRAILMVGTGQLAMLALGTILMTSFRGIPPALGTMYSFWKHSLACAVTARLIAKRAGVANPESFFVAGLLHDLSLPIIFNQAPTHAMYLMAECRRQHCHVAELEEEILGFTHAEFCMHLLERWNCPPELIERVRRHHTPPAPSKPETAVLPVADFLAQAFGYSVIEDTHLMPLGLQPWASLNLSAADLPALCSTVVTHVHNLRTLFTPGS